MAGRYAAAPPEELSRQIGCMGQSNPAVFKVAMNWVNNLSVARTGYNDGMLLGFINAVSGNSLFNSGNSINQGRLFGDGDSNKSTVLSSRLNYPAVAYNQTAELPTYMAANAGAFPRDPMDNRLLGYLNIPVDSQPRINGSTGGDSNQVVSNPPTALADSDGDGIPDVWEAAIGTDANSASDGLQQASSGYLNLERYLNALSDRRVAGSLSPQ